MGETIRFIGVGSPEAGDDAGQQAVMLLQRCASVHDDSLSVEWLIRDRPGVSLLSDWAGANTVVLVDAMLCGTVAGEVMRLQPEQLLGQADRLSSHSVGVAEALALAVAIDALPPRMFLYGIECAEKLAADNWLPRLASMITDDLDGMISFSSPS